MLNFYGDKKSGNCYKIRLLLNQLDSPFEWIDIDIMKNESRTQEFLARLLQQLFSGRTAMSHILPLSVILFNIWVGL